MSKEFYGCNTRQPDYVGRQDTFLVQDGYIEIKNKSGLVVGKQPRYVYMRNRMSKECRYDRIEIDPKCKGCESGEEALKERMQDGQGSRT